MSPTGKDEKSVFSLRIELKIVSEGVIYNNLHCENIVHN